MLINSARVDHSSFNLKNNFWSGTHPLPCTGAKKNQGELAPRLYFLLAHFCRFPVKLYQLSFHLQSLLVPVITSVLHRQKYQKGGRMGE